MSKKTVLRLVIPEWHGGVNPNYVFGAELLSHIAPQDKDNETIQIDVDTDFHKELLSKDGIDGGDFLLSQMKETERVLAEKQPDRLIVFGGDCSVTQVPFDYLSGKYKGSIGIIWLDAHPDMSNPAQSSHLHEMVLGNLLGQNSASEITQVKHPFESDKVIMGGLIEERLREMDKACKESGLKILSPEELKESSETVLQWIKTNGLKQIAVHWDLDVLSPLDFRSIYPSEPYTDADAFAAAVGRMSLNDVCRLLNDVSLEAEIVGLSITEHLPWDAFNLRKTLSGLPIFN